MLPTVPSSDSLSKTRIDHTNTTMVTLDDLYGIIVIVWEELIWYIIPGASFAAVVIWWAYGKSLDESWPTLVGALIGLYFPRLVGKLWELRNRWRSLARGRTLGTEEQMEKE